MLKAILTTVFTTALLAAPQFVEAKEYKIKWKRSISSGVFDQETFFHWTVRGADGLCRNDTGMTVKVKKKPKKGTLQWVYISRVLTTGECAGTLASGYQFIYTPKRKPKKDRVVLEIKGLDRMSEGKLDVDKARIDIQIKKR